MASIQFGWALNADTPQGMTPSQYRHGVQRQLQLVGPQVDSLWFVDHVHGKSIEPQKRPEPCVSSMSGQSGAISGGPDDERAFSSRRARRDRAFLVAVWNVRFRAPNARTPSADAMDGAPYRRTRDEGRPLRVLAF